MNDRCLVDTNVLVYSVDYSSVRKSEIARNVLEGLIAARRVVTTPQAVAEFYVNTTRQKNRLSALLSEASAAQWIDNWMGVAEWLDLTSVTSREAVRAAVSYGMNIYDAQMWAVARTYEIPVLVTEDSQFAPVIEGVRYVNPFDRSFQLADIGL